MSTRIQRTNISRDDLVSAGFSYNPYTGEIASKQKSTRKDGYIMISCRGTTYLGHRLAWLYITGKMPSQDIDHIDGDPRNNKWENLRLCSHSQNMKNRKIQKNNKSGKPGVYYSSQRGTWWAEINSNGTRHYLGSYQTKSKAIEAREDAEREMFGEFKR